MYTVNIVFRGTPIGVSFTYKQHKDAEAAYRRVKQGIEPGGKTDEEFYDDYGLRSFIHYADISGVTFADFKSDMKKNGELSLIAQQAQIKVNKAVQSDPTLRLLNSGGNIAPFASN